MAERGLPPEDLPLQSPPDGGGHADSPDETLSPTSVIYFKEALNSSNLRFGKPESSSPPPPTPLRQYDFRIERFDSRRRSKWPCVEQMDRSMVSPSHTHDPCG